MVDIAAGYRGLDTVSASAKRLARLINYEPSQRIAAPV